MINYNKFTAAIIAGTFTFSLAGAAFAAEEKIEDTAMEKCVGTDKADPKKVVELKKGECITHGGTVVPDEEHMKTDEVYKKAAY